MLFGEEVGEGRVAAPAPGARTPLTSHKPGALTVAQAGVEGYTATLAWGAGIVVVGAVLSALLIPNRALASSEGEPVITH
ncbi:hypothetical protein [Streptomyces sp. NPDC093795]|uniref:hypothetical protein n=1 Tax=Streptomyces sp. NPDC093795 TaxID=3366051 RepID=UPI003828C758